MTIEITDLNADQAAFLDRGGLTKFSNRAAVVAAALAEYGRQRDAALRLQRTLLPPDDLDAPGWDLVTEYLPGTFGLDVGGDWYDVAVLDDRVVCSVGDVSGIVIEAAALMGRLRSIASVEFEQGNDVADVFRLLDRICEQNSQMATMLVVEIDPTTETARLWSAGHLPPILLTDRATVVNDLTVSPPLGHLRSTAVGSTMIDLPVDAGIVLFTDGLVERRGEELTTSIDRMARTIAPGDELAQIVADLVAAHDHDQADDLAVLALRPERSG